MEIDATAQECLGQGFLGVAGDDDQGIETGLLVACFGSRQTDPYLASQGDLELGYVELVLIDLGQEIIGHIPRGLVDLVDQHHRPAWGLGIVRQLFLDLILVKAQHLPCRIAPPGIEQCLQMQESRRQRFLERFLVGALITAGVIMANEVIAIEESLGLGVGFDDELQRLANSHLPGDAVGQTRLPGTGLPGEQQGHPQGGSHIHCRGQACAKSCERLYVCSLETGGDQCLFKRSL